jgi:hypothetical protein
MTRIPVQVGTKFRAAYADTNALWRVTRLAGDTAHCVIVNEPWEHNGQTFDGD